MSKRKINVFKLQPDCTVPTFFENHTATIRLPTLVRFLLPIFFW